jgi:hypothetical protein
MLPGEAEGRVYHFRHLHIANLPEDGDRYAWLEGFQNVMCEQAAQAVHGSDRRAGTADAVYFRNGHEECESLLMLLAAGATPSAWFWQSFSGHTANFPAPLMATGVIEKLLAMPASWSAVSASVLAVASAHDVVKLLNLFPDHTIEAWLRELGGSNRAHFAPIRFPAYVVPILARAVQTLGSDHPKMLWLACLGVIASAPASVDNQHVVAIARASLRRWHESFTTSMHSHALETARVSALRENSPPWIEASKVRMENSAPLETERVTASQENPPSWIDASKVRGENSAPLETERVPTSRENPPSWIDASKVRGENNASLVTTGGVEEMCFGEPTSGAGLYFLLNALRHLRVEEQQWSLLFLARLFQRIAVHAEIEKKDPILRWTEVVESQSYPEEVDPRLIRLWVLNIRRWCWRNGRVSVREVTRREGHVTLTKTDLDVTMPLDSADIRIRRIGLDLNPGWLPWFGRVVHFHYQDRGGFRG